MSLSRAITIVGYLHYRGSQRGLKGVDVKGVLRVKVQIIIKDLMQQQL